MTQQNVSYVFKKLGIIRKKTYGYKERDETQRAKFIEKLGEVETEKIVYVDEAGFDNREDYGYGYSL